jgi:ABC-type multidrug transport system permease subunit
MAPGLRAALGKDFRLLARDRVGLVFLTLAPIVVITVAGVSLANLYGDGSRGGTAYVLPDVDEDGGGIERSLRERVGQDSAVTVETLASRGEALARVRAKRAGAALVVPPGTTDALAAGRPAALLLFTDPVKSIEVASVRALVQELRHEVETGARERASAALDERRAEAEAARAAFERDADALERDLRRLAAAREEAVAGARAALERRLTHAARAQRAEAVRRLAGVLAPLRAFLAELATSRLAFTSWAAAVRTQAGRFADRFPPPPQPPTVPSEVADLATLDADGVAARVLPEEGSLPDLESAFPRLPKVPEVSLPALPALTAASLPGPLGIEETSVTGAPKVQNTFDQNVPGFSVTFLLLGALLGVSLGLLDERDWGTLDRLRATPTSLGTILVAKLVARAGVGFAQMALLFAVGWIAFGVSLGPEPWGLLLPTTGIVCAGTAFGLVVAGLTRSREAVLPIGSIAVLTMSASGGCWWPIDLEPAWMRTAALAFPTTWAMDAFNDLMIRRRPPGAVVSATAALFAFAAAYLVLGLVLFRRRAARA